jgi:hypothetical protein
MERNIMSYEAPGEAPRSEKKGHFHGQLKYKTLRLSDMKKKKRGEGGCAQIGCIFEAI